MRQLESDLWQSTVHRSGILSTHAYFLERRGGNVLFYNTGDERDLDRIAELGGIRYQLLSHRDESGPSLDRIRTQLRLEALLQRPGGSRRPPATRPRSTSSSRKATARSKTSRSSIPPAIRTGASAFSTGRRTASRTCSPATRSFSGTRGGQPLSFAMREEARRRSSRACSGCATSNPMSSCGAGLSATSRSPRSRARSGGRPLMTRRHDCAGVVANRAGRRGRPAVRRGACRALADPLRAAPGRTGTP